MGVKHENDFNEWQYDWANYHRPLDTSEPSVVALLDDGIARTAQAIASQLGADERTIDIWARILVKSGLLVYENGLFRATPVARELKQPFKKREWRRHNIAKLPQTAASGLPAVTTGREVTQADETDIRRTSQPYYTSEIKVREAVTAVGCVWDEIADDSLCGSRILDMGFGNCATLAVDVDHTLHGPRILDLGGGHGCYAAAFANAFFGAQVTLFDREADTQSAHDFSGTVFDMRAGRLLQDNLGGPYDIVFMPYILSGISANDAGKLFQRFRAIVPTGGAVVIGEAVADRKCSKPRLTNDSNLDFLLENEAGQFKTTAKVTALLNEAGFCNQQRIRANVENYGYVIGR
ncbi:MAG: methyltransferase [Aggregatilineales bacterium]